MCETQTFGSAVERGIIMMKQCRECGEHYHKGVRFCPRDGQVLGAVISSYSGEKKDDRMIGLVLAGRYRLLAKLGEGGMGVVYKARHITMNRLAAVKILTSELAGNPDFVARFQREAEMASYLDHPNAVAVYDFGEAEDGLVYLAMKFIDGQALASIIENEGLPLERAVNIIRQTAAALDAAQRVGLIHRDLKPHNVMVSRRTDLTDWVEVVDFGAAKLTRVEPRFDLTRRGFVLGTPEYMSPEQVTGQELDTRSDVYSLGLIAYEMITGALPFEGATSQERMISRLFEPPLPFARVRSDSGLPPGVERVIRKALASDRDQRYSSAVDFALELEAEASSKKTSYQRPVAQTSPLFQDSEERTVLAVPLHDSAPTIRVLAETSRGKDAVRQTWRRHHRALAVIPGLTAALVAALFLGSHLKPSPRANEDIAATSQPAEQLSTEKSPEEEELTTPAKRPDEGSGAQASSPPARASAKKAQNSASTAHIASTSPPDVAANIDQFASPASDNPEVRSARSEDHVKVGMEFLNAGSSEKAIAEFSAAQKSAPSNQDVHYLMGLAYEQLKRPADALAHYLLCKSGPYAGLSSQHVKRLTKRLGKSGLDRVATFLEKSVP